VSGARAVTWALVLSLGLHVGVALGLRRLVLQHVSTGTELPALDVDLVEPARVVPPVTAAAAARPPAAPSRLLAESRPRAPLDLTPRGQGGVRVATPAPPEPEQGTAAPLAVAPDLRAGAPLREGGEPSAASPPPLAPSWSRPRPSDVPRPPAAPAVPVTPPAAGARAVAREVPDVALWPSAPPSRPTGQPAPEAPPETRGPASSDDPTARGTSPPRLDPFASFDVAIGGAPTSGPAAGSGPAPAGGIGRAARQGGGAAQEAAGGVLPGPGGATASGPNVAVAPGQGGESRGVTARPSPDSTSIPREYEDYVRGIRRRVQERLVYPWMAVRRRMSGVIELELEVDGTGRLVAVAPVGGEAPRLLRDAALQAVRDASPFPLPPGVPPRALTLRLPVVFELLPGR